MIPSLLQSQSAGGRTEVFAGSTLESYLRYLQTLGKAPSEQWSVRGFSLRETDAHAPQDSIHPWAHRYSFRRDGASHIDYVRPAVQLIENTSFPFGGNDGPIWAGKGVTAAFQAGVTGEWGPLSIRLAPVVFAAQNSSFELYDNGQTGALRYAHGQFYRQIDLPQRFGNSTYSRFDPGESTAQLEAFGATIGASTASQWWGPTDQFPYVLGNNAGGVPRVFLGTAKPANLKIIKLHTRLQYGVLDQSPYSPAQGSQNYVNEDTTGTRRYMAGLVAVLQIARVPGFELGGARFFHAPSRNGIDAHVRGLPFLQLFRRQMPLTEGKENQLGSLFIRWAPPRTGFDIYGEYGREDFAADTRDYLLEPEHAATTNVGLRKAWTSGSAINAVKAEVFSYEAPGGSRTRAQGEIFVHGILRQGHTYRGQLLSANVGPGSGNAQSVGFDRFTTNGRMSFYFSRVTQYEDRIGLTAPASGTRDVDVMNSLGAEVSRFLGHVDMTLRLVLTRELGRYLEDDASNANLGVTLRGF